MGETLTTTAAPPPAAARPPDGGADDRALVARVAAGDRQALEALYRRHAGWLTVRLQRRCHDPELVDSALQDAFLAVWRGAASRYRGEGDVAAWLWGIAVRRLLDLLRRRRPVPVDPSALSGSLVGDDVAPTAAVVDSAEAAALARSIGGDLAAAFTVLPPELQSVLLATAVDGLTTREAADLLGIPQGTVKTRLARARALLQERLA